MELLLTESRFASSYHLLMLSIPNSIIATSHNATTIITLTTVLPVYQDLVVATTIVVIVVVDFNPRIWRSIDSQKQITSDTLGGASTPPKKSPAI